jgi:hypothetical protein
LLALVFQHNPVQVQQLLLPHLKQLLMPVLANSSTLCVMLVLPMPLLLPLPLPRAVAVQPVLSLLQCPQCPCCHMLPLLLVLVQVVLLSLAVFLSLRQKKLQLQHCLLLAMCPPEVHLLLLLPEVHLLLVQR